MRAQLAGPQALPARCSLAWSTPCGIASARGLMVWLVTRVPADPEDPMRVTDQTRPMGLIVCRGTSVMLVVPTAGTEEIANPFQQEEMEA